MIASNSCQQKINRHVNVQIWHGCISPLHVSGLNSMAVWIRPKPIATRLGKAMVRSAFAIFG